VDNETKRAVEEDQATQVPTTTPEDTGSRRERSRIAFPYGDLEDALDVTKAVFQNGGQRAGFDQLASWMGHETVESGTFRFKVTSARIFGLVNVDRGQVSLTELGLQIVDPKSEIHARAHAFVNVPLYRKIYENYKGRLLPKDTALEQDMERLGVAPKQRIRARQTFQRSASQAGMFNETKDRLIPPGGVSLDSTPMQEAASRKMENNGRPSVEQSTPDLSAALLALFDILPPAGSEWSREKRQQWIEFAEHLFNRLYKERSDNPQ
jgi:hypothetical protein